MKRVDVLIIGDFPPATHTGISMVNAMVHDILLSGGKRVHIIDESAWIYRGAKRVLHYLFGSHFKLIAFLVKSRPNYVYLNIPLSLAGQVRLFFTCSIVKFLAFRAKIVGHIHRGDILEFANTSRLNKLIFRVNLSFFDRVAVLSGRFAEDLRNVKQNINIEVIPNTSAIENRSRTTKSYKRSFICVSNIIETKGLHDLVQAFCDDRFKSFNLKIVGSIYEPLFYQRLKKESCLNVSFITNADREAVTNLMLESDCLILPSWNEGQPLVVLEAMSIGLPVIASAVGDIPGMLGNDYPFLFQPRNVHLLKEKIAEFDMFEPKTLIEGSLLSAYKTRYSNQLFRSNVTKLFA